MVEGWRGRWMPLLGLLIAGAALAGCAAAIDPQAIADAQTAARVRTALVNDTTLGARPIEVRVTGGVAHLTGRVLTQDEAARAAALARGVPGVTSVESRLQVGGDLPAETALPPAGSGRDVEDELRELQTSPSLLALGVSLSRTYPLEDVLSPRAAIGPMVKLGSGRGLGPVIGFNWFHADVAVADGGPVSRIYLKPFMAGVGYTIGPDDVSLTAAIVGGVAFNSLKVREPAAGPLAVDVGNSFVWRPNVSVWRNLTRRTALNISAGYIATRLRVTFIDGDTVDVRRMGGNTVVVSGGVAYRLF